MYIAVVAVIAGQGLILGNERVLEYGGLVWLCFPLVRSRVRGTTFGPEYKGFCSGVSRWLPRLRPWPGHNGHAPFIASGLGEPVTRRFENLSVYVSATTRRVPGFIDALGRSISEFHMRRRRARCLGRKLDEWGMG